MSISLLNSSPTIALASGFTGEPLCFTTPREIIAAYTLDDVAPAVAFAQQRSVEGFWVAGFVAYEAASAFDPALPTHSHLAGEPLVWFGVFDGLCESQETNAGLTTNSFTIGNWATEISEEQYTSAFRQIHDAIARGETYQANYTFALETDFDGDPWAYFLQLIGASQAAYGAFIDTGSQSVLSASPELFFRLSDRHIVCRPMKGTTPRGLWSEQDQERADWLRHSEKNRAENVMIVDLMRSDLGRIAEMGSVRVTSLFDVEALPTVWQMTSTVRATLKPNIGLKSIFDALFPCGSITGAPKRSTMNLIESLEPQPRGVYCGAIGVIKPGGDATFNVAIRTVVVDREKKRARCGVGGGITWDSDAADERREAMSKSAFLRGNSADFKLLETLRLENGEFWLLDRHMHRLTQSARYFAFQFNEFTIRERLAGLALENIGEAFRVRMLLDRSGEIQCEIYPLAPIPVYEQKVRFANDPIDIADPFLYHKTTNRGVYERYRAEYPDCFDVLLWNERREVTEFTIGNLVIEIEGMYYTPPVESGLLPGTFRSELLEAGEIFERAMSLDDVLAANHIFMINSVRGWVPITFR